MGIALLCTIRDVGLTAVRVLTAVLGRMTSRGFNALLCLTIMVLTSTT